MQVLDYNKWEKFAKVIQRAMIACENSGHSLSEDLPTPQKSIQQLARLKKKAKQNNLMLDE